MTLTDTGPIVALFDVGDAQHSRCVAVARDLPPGPLFTTWPCFTEAMYLLGKVGGYRYQETLWRFLTAGRLVLHDLSATEADRCRVLMGKYRDAPMDLADASLVAVAETKSLRRIFTLDRHFRIYRLPDGGSLEMVPDGIG